MSDGLNGGIVSARERAHRHFGLAHCAGQGSYLAPADWIAAADEREGAWWLEWVARLGGHPGEPIAWSKFGALESGDAAVADAPAAYVREK